MAEVAERGAWARARRVLQAEVDPKWGGQSWGQRRALTWLDAEVEALRREAAACLGDRGRAWREAAWKTRVRAVVAGHMLSLQRDELEAERNEVQRDDARVRVLQEGLRHTERDVIDALEVLRRQLAIAQAVDALAPDADLAKAEAWLCEPGHSGADGSYQQILTMTFADSDALDAGPRATDPECVAMVRNERATELLGCAMLFCLLTATQAVRHWGLAEVGENFQMLAQEFAEISGLEHALARAVAGLVLLRHIPGDEGGGAGGAASVGRDSDSDDRTVMVTEEVEQASMHVVGLLAPIRLRELWLQRAPGLDTRCPDGLYVIKALRERSLGMAALKFYNTAGERLWPSTHPNRFTVLEVLMDDIAWAERDKSCWRQRWMQLLVLLRQPPVLENALEGVLKRVWQRVWQDPRATRALLSEIMLKTPFSFDERKTVAAVLEEKARSSKTPESRLAYDLLVALHILHNNSELARAAHEQDMQQNGNGKTSNRLRVRGLLVDVQTASSTPHNLAPRTMHDLGGLLENSASSLSSSSASIAATAPSAPPPQVANGGPMPARSYSGTPSAAPASSPAPRSAYFSRRGPSSSLAAGDANQPSQAAAVPGSSGPPQGAQGAAPAERTFFSKQTPGRLLARPERTQTPPYQSRPRRAREAMPVAASSQRVRPSPFAGAPGSGLKKTSSSMSSSSSGSAASLMMTASQSPMKRGAQADLASAQSGKKQPPSTTPFKQLHISRRK